MGTRARGRSARPGSPGWRWSRSSGTRKGWSASRAARATGRWRAVGARRDQSGRAVGRRLLGAFGPDRFRVELQRPFWRRDRARNRWLAALAERLGVPCVATGNVHCHDRPRARLQDAFVAVRLRRDAWRQSEPQPARQLLLGAGAAGGDGGALRRPSRARSPRPRGSPSGSRFDLTSELGYRYPGAEDPDADRALAELCRARLERALRRRRRERREAERAARGGAARSIRALGLSGFFLLHHDCSSWPARSPPRCAAPTRRARCCRPAAAAAPASARSSAI